MLHANISIGRKLLDDLLRTSMEAIFFLRNSLKAELDRQAAREVNRIWISAFLSGPFANIIKTPSQLPWGNPHKVWKPGVTVARRADLSPNALASDPNGYSRFLKGLGIKSDLAKAVVTALETRPLLFP